MKFGKEFRRQKVPEWVEAYMDYDGLKRLLKEVIGSKQGKSHLLPQRSSNVKLRLDKSLSKLLCRAESRSTMGDIEDQVIQVNQLEGDDGPRKIYRTNFLKQSERGWETEARFFENLDHELNKVNSFYKDKVEEVMREATLLSKQMDAFVALRAIVNNPGKENMHSSPVSSTEQNMQEGSSLHEAPFSHPELNRAIEKGSDRIEKSHSNQNGKDPLEILENVKINNNLESPISVVKRVFTDSKKEELLFNKEELKKVQNQLRRAFIEFYHKILILKHYSFMNLSGFAKIMKKYEEVTSRAASRAYLKVVDNSYLGNSDELKFLMEKVESIFVKNFAKSNCNKGKSLLRPKQRKEKHSVTFFTGFFSGCFLILLVAIGLRIQSQHFMDRKEGSFYMENIFPLYSLFGYIILHMLMYAANTYFWRKYHVNYPFIFGFKRGTELGYREIFLLTSGLAVLTLTGFLVNLHLEMDPSAKNYKTFTELVPLFLVAIVTGITLCPFNVIYRSSRFFFIKCNSLFSCICAPLYPVTLSNFFLADQLTSQTQALRSFELYICYYGLGEKSRRQQKCHTHGIYNTFYFIIVIVPFWLRLLQCIRRLCEEKGMEHALNGLKYFSAIIAIIIRTKYELRKGMGWKMSALVSSAVAVVLNTYWDIVVDWGLLRRHSRNIYLREKLLIPHKSFYFAAMVLNVILRLSWMQLVLEVDSHATHKTTIIMIVSCLEIIRRGMWNFFRLENEHLNNVGKYRAFKFVPLPFNYCEGDDDEKDDD